MGMELVVDQFEIAVPESKDVAYFRVDFHLRKRKRLAAKLKPDLFQVVGIDVHIPAGPYEIAGLVSANLRHHQGEEGIGSNIEGNTQKYIATSLVKLAGKLSPGHIKLKQKMTGRKVHFVEISYIPCAYDMPS